MKKFFNRIVKTFKNTILCIKYPFLYPRNRFTDKHYENHKIHNKIYTMKKLYDLLFHIKVMDHEKFAEYMQNPPKNHYLTPLYEYKDCKFNMIRQHTDVDDIMTVYAFKSDKIVGKTTFNISDYYTEPDLISDIIFDIESYKTYGAGIVENRSIILVVEDIQYKKNNFISQHLCIMKYLNLRIKLLRLLNSFMGIFHILPTHTELDGLEEGWRIRFGEDICKEIKHSILHTYTSKLENPDIYTYIKAYIQGIKFLYKYRIMQIKEKFGGLRWYDSASTEEILGIISKYEIISENTCIVCGKPAKYRTRGWICPYCENHKPNDNVILIKDYNNNDKIEEQ